MGLFLQVTLAPELPRGLAEIFLELHVLQSGTIPVQLPSFCSVFPFDQPAWRADGPLYRLCLPTPTPVSLHSHFLIPS